MAHSYYDHVTKNPGNNKVKLFKKGVSITIFEIILYSGPTEPI